MKISKVVLLTAALMLCTAHLRAQVTIIANPGVSASSISKSELRSVFTGESLRLKDGSHVKPVLLKEGTAHAAFLSGDLSMSAVSLLVCWRQKVFSGEAVMPPTFSSEAEAVAYIVKTPGAIGYITATTPHEGVKVLVLK